MPDTRGYPKTSPLQIFPKGLLGFLQLKNGGEMPQRLASETLVPNIDLRDWYLGTNEEIEGIALVGVVAPATQNIVTVGPKEFLWVRLHTAMVVGGSAAAGEFVTITPVLRYPVTFGAGTLSLPMGPTGTSSAAPAGQDVTSIARDYLAPPGSIIAVRMTGTFVNIDVEMAAVFSRLPI